MKAKISATILVVMALIVTVRKSYGCPNQAPQADLKAKPQYILPGKSVTLDGSGSIDPDGTITTYYWDFTNNGSWDYSETSSSHPDGEFNGKTTHTYDSTRTAKLRVKDNDGAYGYATCDVNVSGDSDNDGLPAGWEELYDLNDANFADADEDLDDDGYNNLCEYLHNSDPNNSGSKPDANFPITIYVPGVVNCIQRAINASIDGDTVVVSEGTYYEHINFNSRKITLTSTDPNNPDVVAATIIDGNDVNSVVTFSSGDANSVLTGFTITDGNTGIDCNGTSPKIINCTITDNNSATNGGGMYCTNSASPTITNCTFSNNSADDYGGGMYNHDSSPNLTNCTFSNNCTSWLEGYGGGMYNSNSSPQVTDCTFSKNYAGSYGGGVCNSSSSCPNFTDCTFSGNSTECDNGGGMYNVDSSPTVVNCVFSENYVLESGYNGGGMSNYNSSPTVTNCVFSKNSTDYGCGGAMSNESSSPTVINCIFVENSAGDEGGGMYNVSSSPTLINCTFTGNEGCWGGGGMRNYVNSDPNVTNCIFWGNKAGGFYDEILNDIGSDPNVTYCDVKEGYPGTGNIDSDPCFADADNAAGADGVFGTLDDGLCLRTDSPCIDAGDPDTDSNDVGTVDLQGNERFLDGDHNDTQIIDMGAYELPTVWYVDGSVQGGSGDGSSWVNAFEYLQDALSDANDGDEIWVADGNYKPDCNESNPTGSGQREATFQLKEGVALYGGFDGSGTAHCDSDWIEYQTILSGDINEPSDANDNSYHVVTGADGAVLDGFTITCGNANDSGADSHGGGIYCDGNSVTLERCVIAENAVDANGGGIYCVDSDLTLTNCIISENDANRGGGMYDNNSLVSVINCTFARNSAGTVGGGIRCVDESQVTVVNSILAANQADYGEQMALSNCSISVSYSCVEGYSEPASHWKLDEGSGITTYDSASNNDGNLFGDPCWVAGQIGSHALEFDGDGDYVRTSYEGGPTEYTVALWYNLNEDIDTSTFGGYRALLSKTADETPTVDCWSIWWCTTYGLGLSNEKSQSNYASVVYKPAMFYKDEWRHVAVTGTTTQGKIYFDGELKNTSDDDFATGAWDDSVPFDIARPYNGTADRFFNGKIDDVHIYDRVLSAEEIEQIYQNAFISMGEGNIDGDPCFMDVNNPAGSDGVFGTFDDGLRLSPDSFCIDAADGDVAPSTDITGEARIDINDVNDKGTGVPEYTDMGAYEHHPIVHNVTQDLYYPTIQNAIDHAASGNYIKVNPGAYRENIDFKDKAITLASTDPNALCIVAATIIDGKQAGHTVTFSSGEEANSVITGFTIRNGSNYGIYCDGASPTITSCIISDNGYGVSCKNYSSPTIAGCTISDNARPGIDYAVCCENNSSPTITNCTITDNGNTYDDKAVYCNDSTLDISGCTIRNNKGYAMHYVSSSDANISDCNIMNNDYGVYCSGSDVNISGCSIRDHSNYGIQLKGSCSATVKNCEIFNCGHGIQCVQFGQAPQATIVNCLILNSSDTGIYAATNGGSSTTITNCTIVGSTSRGILGPFAEIKNCVVWGNDDDLSGCSATYSCIEDGDGGLGNFSFDPCFVNADANNFHLLGGSDWPWSPCIDAGDPCSDYSNEPEPNGGRINIGRYGNTEEAATVTIIDSDEDGLPDAWESYYWPNDDPNQHDPNEDDDGDGLKNIVEYRIRWDPNTDDSNSIPGYVGNERTDLQYPGISSAIDYALDGDTLIVGPGIYNETVYFLGKKVTVTSTDPNNFYIVAATIIDSSGLNDNAVTFTYSEDANSVLRGFTITGNTRGIYCSGSSPKITNCVITNNTLAGGGDGAGLYCTNSASPTITNCIFSGNIANEHDNEAYGHGGGIYCEDSTPTLTYCIVTENEAEESGAGMYCEDSNLTVTNCIISENKAREYAGGGIYCKNSDPMVTNCIIFKNETEAGCKGGGMYNENSSPSVVNCTFIGNHSGDDGGGIYNDGTASKPIVTNCIFWGNTADGDGDEIYNSNNADPNFTYCDIKGGLNNLPGCDGNPSSGDDNINSDPLFVDVNSPPGLDGTFGTWDDGLRVLAYSPCVDAADGNAAPSADVTGQSRVDVPYRNNNGVGDCNYADIGTYESLIVWFVDANASGSNNGASWNDAFIYLQSALASASDGNEIWVAEGTYKPDTGDPNNRSLSFELVEGVAVYGGFANTGRHQRDLMAHETILSGDINEPGDSNDNSYHVVIGAGGAFLKGFTIKGGNADGPGTDSYGGGIYCDGNSPTIRRCVVVENWAYYDGGGIYCEDSNLSLTNCIISENNANSGGGMYNQNSSPLVTNCTFSGNFAVDDGGGMCNYGTLSQPMVTNSIFWGNHAVDDGNDIHNDNNADPNFSYSDIAECKDCNGIWDPNYYADCNGVLEWDPNFGTDGGGNIKISPQFKDVNCPAGLDGVFGTWDDGLRLGCVSPCIDAADGDTAPLTDILGFGRFDDITVSNTGAGCVNYADMGAYESQAGWDDDGDGMQDDWEILFGLDPCDPSDADDDPDQDGADNVWEYINDSHPFDPNSFPYANPEPLPYYTSFEAYQGFPYTAEGAVDLDGIKNWRVSKGEAWLGHHTLQSVWHGQSILVRQHSVAYATFDDKGEHHEYIKCKLYPTSGAKILIKNGARVIAGLRFGSWAEYYLIQVLDGSDYVWSAKVWWDDLRSYKFVMDYDNHTYDVFYKDECIYENADFATDCDTLTTLEMQGGILGYDFFMDSLSISDVSSTGGEPNDGSIDITSPCACTDDVLKGRVPVKGSVWWQGTDWRENMGLYEIKFCPADLDMYDANNWYVADKGTNMVVDDLLGYWDTSSIPNGYYHLGIQLYKDLGYGSLPGPDGNGAWPKTTLPYVIWKTVDYGYYEQEGAAVFAVIGDLKCNTFYHEEGPDISVSWPGQFPFELKRMYNNNRRFYSKPFHNGWTHNNQITLVEDSKSYFEEIDSGMRAGYPCYDKYYMAFGDIWVTDSDGSKKRFKHVDGSEPDNSTTKYYPDPNDNSGEYIERTSSGDTELLLITGAEYVLKRRDGSTLSFNSVNLSIDVDPDQYGYGMVFDPIMTTISEMSDRFGNTLTYGWNNDDTAVTSITYDRPDGNEIGIILELDGSNEYYTKAELRAGVDVDSGDANDYEVYRTVSYEWDDANDIFNVIKEGYGVDVNGVYDPCNVKEYVTQYKYDPNMNLIKIAYDEDTNNPSIEIEYDSYGRVALRKDYVDPNNYLPTDFEYTMYHPNPEEPNFSYLETDTNTPYRWVATIQNQNGAAIERYTITSDDSNVTDVNCTYGDSNPLKPVDVNEYFDGLERRTWNDYSNYTPGGDLIEQRVYLDDVSYVSTEMAYHTAEWTDEAGVDRFCVLRDSKTSYQGLSKSGQEVETQYTYGDADGTPNPTSGVYLVEEKVLLSEDPNVWATTKYEYNDNGLVKKKTDPNNFITFYEYDDKGHRKLVKVGTNDSNEPVQRYYHDAIGQLCLEATSLGGVTLNDYDEFGRLWKVRTYDDANAMTKPDVNFVPEDYNDLMEPTSTTIYGYDARGNRTYERKPAGGEIITDYTTSGLVKYTTYDDDSYVEYIYDSRGLKISEDYNDANTGLDWHVEFDYDSMDRPNDTRWYDYNDTTIVKSRSSEYYGSGKKKYDKILGYDVLEKQTDYYYDILGRMTDRLVAPGDLDLTTTYNYDGVGNRASMIDPNGSVIYFDYDNANRRIKEYFAAASGTTKANAKTKKEIEYYKNNLVKDVNSYDYGGSTLLARSEFEYDARRRLTKVTQQIDDGNEAVTVYDYNDSGLVYDGNEYQIRITDANDKYTHIALDAFGRRVKVLYPSDDYEELEYNGDGTLSTRTVFNTAGDPCYVDYYYDGYARLTDVNYPDGSNVHYSYDGFGRKTLVEDSRNANDNIGGDGQIAYDYDVLGRITTIIDQNDYEISYIYMADGQKASIDVNSPSQGIIYWVEYYYDAAGRLEQVNEPLLEDELIAEFEYDDNGNRTQMAYSLDGIAEGNSVSIDYVYNRDNLLTGYSTSSVGVTGPTFTLTDANVDGLGRLTDANEIVTKIGGNTVAHLLTYQYDMLSQLTDANISDINSSNWVAQYTYKKNGDIASRTIQGTTADFTYDGHLMDTATGGETFDLDWDENGNMVVGVDVNMVYNWDNKLRSGEYGSDSISLKYDPSGNRIWKQSTVSGSRKYIVDTVGGLPVILLEIDTSDDSIAKSYIYANSQIIAQHDGDTSDELYFYLHDRLGSVREIIDANGDVVNTYTYEPFGEEYPTEANETLDNPFRFAGQFFDAEIAQYYLRARQYDPYLGRFTSRDPVFGEFEEPMTLHVYLYCLNDPINRTDPAGEFTGTKEEVLGTTLIRAGVQAGIDTAAVGLAYWALHRVVQQMQDYHMALSLAHLNERLMEPILAWFAAGKGERFKGGKITQRDRWHGLEKKPHFKGFKKWFHYIKQRFYKGQKIQEEEMKRLYKEYVEKWARSKKW